MTVTLRCCFNWKERLDELEQILVLGRELELDFRNEFEAKVRELSLLFASPVNVGWSTRHSIRL